MKPLRCQRRRPKLPLRATWPCSTPRAYTIALRRFRLLQQWWDLIHDCVEPREALGLLGISSATLHRWTVAYEQGGFPGLFPGHA